MTTTQNGLGSLWIVTQPTADSELIDVLFQASPRDLALQVRGGLEPDEILGWFDNHSEANQIALQAIHVAQSNKSEK